MEQQEVDQLINKYLNGTADDHETEALLQWYRRQLKEDVVWESDIVGEESAIKARIAEKIRMETQVPVDRRQILLSTKSWKWAVAGGIAAGLFGALLWFGIPTDNGHDDRVTQRSSPTILDSKEDAQENRFFMLHDSSKVVLRPGSTLEYRSDFTGKTREVLLIGEGYFDIRRDESRPFIVHAGDVQTVVLGTAFTIKAEAGQANVQVTVKHGKVRVQRQQKVLAELVANQQLQTDRRTDVVAQKNVVAEDAIAWTAEDLRFDAELFGELTKRLARRYGIQIVFKNQDLANCPVTGKFQGGETLEEVLTTLCFTRNATFKRVRDGVIEIAGKGCLLPQ